MGNDNRDGFIVIPLHNFNPRSRVGNDSLLMGLICSPKISIHVPAWGTTAFLERIPTTVLFQSTFPRGERRHIHLPRLSRNFYFNPRSRVGNDSKFSQIFFAFLCNKYNFSTFYYPFSLFFGVIHFTFLIFVVRILPVFYVYF